MVWKMFENLEKVLTVNPSTGMLLAVRGKPDNPEESHTDKIKKLYTESNWSSGLNSVLWSCEAPRLPAAPCCLIVTKYKMLTLFIKQRYCHMNWSHARSQLSRNTHVLQSLYASIYRLKEHYKRQKLYVTEMGVFTFWLKDITASLQVSIWQWITSIM